MVAYLWPVSEEFFIALAGNGREPKWVPKSIQRPSTHMWDAGLLEKDILLGWYRDNPFRLKPGSLKLCIDFDFTLTQNLPAYDLRTLPEPQDGAVHAVQELYRMGWHITIFTSRFDRTVFVEEEVEVNAANMLEFLTLHNIPYDRIWKDQCSAKPLATWYLDDRSLPPFRGWSETHLFLLQYMLIIESIWQQECQPYSYSYAVRHFRIKAGGLNMMPDDNVFGDLIFSYSRTQAIEDGVLVDVSQYDVTRQHFKYPVAVSERVWSMIDRAVSDSDGLQSVEGILHDIFWMAKCNGTRIGPSENIFEVLIVTEDQTEPVNMRLVCGPGDDAEPVLTLMLIDED